MIPWGKSSRTKRPYALILMPSAVGGTVLVQLCCRELSLYLLYWYVPLEYWTERSQHVKERSSSRKYQREPMKIKLLAWPDQHHQLLLATHITVPNSTIDLVIIVTTGQTP
jgi:hypothetical protein